MFEELHVESLYPVSVVTPHSHVIVLGDRPLDEADKARIKAWIVEFRGKVIDLETEADNPKWDRYIIERDFYKRGIRKTKPRKPPISMEIDTRLNAELPVSLKFQLLPTERDFSNGLDYLVKPIALASAYQKTRDALIQNNPEGLECLARNVSDFIIGVDLLLTPRRSPTYIGQCDPRRRSVPYIGVPGAILEDSCYRANTKAKLRRLRTGDNDPTDG